MRSSFVLIFFVLLLRSTAQLPPAAQALYNEFYGTNTFVAQSCLNAGATASATADGKTFYLKWFPAGSTASNTPVMVALHGTGSNAFNLVNKWLASAQSHSVGIIALQWYLGASSSVPHDYFGDTTLYTYIDTAMKRLKYPSNKALFLGFSRGSARSYAIQFLDVYPPNGKNYFCTIMSNAGKPDSLYPFYQSINSNTNTASHKFCKGKQWAMYCGMNDPNPARDGCVGMNSAKNNWVMANGGTVGLYIQDLTLPSATAHSGLMDTQAYQDSLLEFYIPCFQSGVQNLKENSTLDEFKLFPNPARDVLNLETGGNVGDVLSIYDHMGKLKKQVKIEYDRVVINVSELPRGLYLIGLGNKKVKFLKE